MFTFKLIWQRLVKVTLTYLKDVVRFSLKSKFTQKTFLVGAHRFGVPFPKLQTISEIFWALHIDYNQYKKTILGIFVYLVIYEVITTKVNFRF